MRPEQLFEFKRDLEELLRVRIRARLERGAAELFEKYDLAKTIKRRRGCRTPPVPFASDAAPPRDYLSGHRSYTGRQLWLRSGGSEDLAWCPTLNALVWRSAWWTSGDNYHRVREESGGSVKVQTPERFLRNLEHGRHHLRVCWTPEELELLEAEEAAAPPPQVRRWPDENGGVLSNVDLKTLRPTERFSERVENYVRYRPGYPREVLDLMRDEMGLRPGSAVADVGSGTGIFTQFMLLADGVQVFAVEPNREMREAAEAMLHDEPGFHSVEGAAEATTLPDRSVDFVTAGQAFHWFDPVRARAEFRRILRPGGHVVLVWNERRLDATPFLRDYERLLVEFGKDYDATAERYARPGGEGERAVREFFGGDYRTARFDNFQDLGYEGLKGRLLSASYVPLPGEARHEEMMGEALRVFREHAEKRQAGGEYSYKVRIEYDTNVYYGRLA